MVNRQVRLVYPIPYEKWIIQQPYSEDGPFRRRKSPRRGTYEDVFNELVSIPQLLVNPNFTLELLLIREEELCRYNRTRAWGRKGWIASERKLLEIVEQRVLTSPIDMHVFFSPDLAESFTTFELATSIAKSRVVAQRIVYCLRLMGCITPVGKRVNSILYNRLNA